MAQKNFQAMAQTLISWGFEPWLKPTFDMQILDTHIYGYKCVFFLYIAQYLFRSSMLKYVVSCLTAILLCIWITFLNLRP